MIDPSWVVAGSIVGTLLVNTGIQLGMHRSNTRVIGELGEKVGILSTAVTTMAAQDPAVQARLAAAEGEVIRNREHYHEISMSLAATDARSTERHNNLARDLSEVRSFLFTKREP